MVLKFAQYVIFNMMNGMPAVIDGMTQMMVAGGDAMGTMAENLPALMESMGQALDGMGNMMASMGDMMNTAATAISENVENGNIEALIDAIDGAMGAIAQGISGNINPEDMEALINGMGHALSGAGAALDRMGTLLDALGQADSLMDLIRALLGN